VAAPGEELPGWLFWPCTSYENLRISAENEKRHPEIDSTIPSPAEKKNMKVTPMILKRQKPFNPPQVASLDPSTSAASRRWWHSPRVSG